MSTYCCFRKSLRPLQHGRGVHTNRRETGPIHGQRLGRRCGQFSKSGGHVPLHSRELHQCPVNGPGPGNVGDARTTDARK